MKLGKGVWRATHVCAVAFGLFAALQFATVFLLFDRMPFSIEFSVTGYVVAIVTVLACAAVPYLCVAVGAWVYAGFAEDSADRKV